MKSEGIARVSFSRRKAGKSGSEAGGDISISWVKYHRRSAEIAEALQVQPYFFRSDARALPLRYLQQLIATWRILRRRRPRVVIVMQPPAIALVTVCAFVWLHGGRVIGDLHTGTFIDPKWRWAKPSVLGLLRRFGMAIVPNEDLARWCADAGVPVTVTHGYIRPQDSAWHCTSRPSREVPRPAGLPAGYVLVPLTYAFDEPLGQLVQAARGTPEITWVFTGDAPKKLRAQVPENVRLTGWVSEEEYRKLRFWAEVVVAVTTKESTMQCAGYEALASCTPLVTSPTRVLRAYFENAARYARADGADLATCVREVRGDAATWSRRMCEQRDKQMAHQDDAVREIRAWIEAQG